VCIVARVGKNLIKKLEIRFLTQSVMDVFRIVYFQYWSQLDSDVSFAKHLEKF